MAESFVVYIDESGDEGFRFDAGSSEWFVLSAIVCRKHLDHRAVELMREVRRLLGKEPKYTVHFQNLKHQQRIPYLDALAKEKFRTISVLCHKKSLTESEYLQTKSVLYFYTARYLIERISWYCRDNRLRDDAGDGSAKIIFSNRSGMSYDDLREYLKKLQENPKTKGEIDWNVIKPDQIAAVPHSHRAGLQAVDAVASSLFSAFEPSRYGFIEDRYVQMMMPVMYRREGQLQGYGVKVWPRDALTRVKASDSYAWLTK